MTKLPTQLVNFENLLTDDVYQAVWRYALRLTSTREDAEDLMQESLVHAWNRLYQLRDKLAFKSWLFSIVRTKHLAHIRKRNMQAESLEDRHYKHPYTIQQTNEEFADAFNRLPESQRELLSLFYIEGLSMKETGMALGIGERAVKLRLFRARTALRKDITSRREHFATGIKGVVQDD